ncbi:hypothetical protein AAHV26_17955 [Klebsiella pneumoniae]
MAETSDKVVVQEMSGLGANLTGSNANVEQNEIQPSKKNLFCQWQTS